MINNNEFIEINNNSVIDRSFLGHHQEWGAGEVVNIDAELVASQNWQDMVDLTQRDKMERGVVVSWNGKRISTSRIILGSEGSFSPPLLPHGPRSLLPTMQDIVYVHTHYMPPEIDHVKTTTVSDKDINSFMNTTIRAMVMVDRGGVHVLTRRPYFFAADEEETRIEIVNKAIERAKASGNTSMEVVHEVAKSLEPLGIKYYYSETLSPISNGSIALKDATKL